MERINLTQLNPYPCDLYYVPTTEEYSRALGAYFVYLMSAGGLITLALFVLFFEQVFYTNAGAHRVFRRHIYWIASVYPVMTLMSLFSVLVPRAHNICNAVKITYMSIGISHFTDLTVLMFGSEEVMLHKTQGDRLNLRLSPCCCCCFCLPSPPVSKNSIRLTIWLADQLPFTQAAYYILLLILISADNVTLGNVNPQGTFLWLNLFNFASFMGGIYALQILVYFSRGYLDFYNYKKKSRSMKTVVTLTKLQNFALDLMGNYGAFPCIPPYIPPQVYKQTVENSLYLVEMMVLGVYTYWQYHSHEFIVPNPAEVVPPQEEDPQQDEGHAPPFTHSNNCIPRSNSSAEGATVGMIRETCNGRLQVRNEVNHQQNHISHCSRIPGEEPREMTESHEPMNQSSRCCSDSTHTSRCSEHLCHCKICLADNKEEQQQQQQQQQQQIQQQPLTEHPSAILYDNSGPSAVYKLEKFSNRTSRQQMEGHTYVSDSSVSAPGPSLLANSYYPSSSNAEEPSTAALGQVNADPLENVPYMDFTSEDHQPSNRLEGRLGSRSSSYSSSASDKPLIGTENQQKEQTIDYRTFTHLKGSLPANSLRQDGEDEVDEPKGSSFFNLEQPMNQELYEKEDNHGATVITITDPSITETSDA